MDVGVVAQEGQDRTCTNPSRDCIEAVKKDIERGAGAARFSGARMKGMIECSRRRSGWRRYEHMRPPYL